MRVLVIDDDSRTARFIRRGLAAEGYPAEVASDGVSGLERALAGRPDLVILELDLPSMDGLEVLRRLRLGDPRVRTIVVSSRSGVVDRVRGLDAGADDYLPKPFSFVELLARVRALFRREPHRTSRMIGAGGYVLDRVERTVSFGDRRIQMSGRECELLDLLMSHAGTPLTRARIADQVWGQQFDTGTNVIDVYVNYVRKKLREVGKAPIRTIRGVGYVFEPEATGEERASLPPS